MRRCAVSIVLALLLSCSVAAEKEAASPRSFRTRDGARLQVQTFVTALEVPWSLAFTSPDRLLVTERPGRVRLVERGILAAKPLAVIEETESSSEMGLMGLALAPDYARSRLVYLSYSYQDSRGISVKVRQYRDEGSRLTPLRTIHRGHPGRPQSRRMPPPLRAGREALRDDRRRDRAPARAAHGLSRWKDAAPVAGRVGAGRQPLPAVARLLPGPPQRPGSRLAPDRPAVPGRARPLRLRRAGGRGRGEHRRSGEELRLAPDPFTASSGRGSSRPCSSGRPRSRPPRAPS